MELSELKIQVGQNVKRAREEAGYKSQRSLAKLLSFSHTKLSEIEKGLSTASNADLKEISQVLNVPVFALMATNPENQKKIMFVEEVLTRGGDQSDVEKVASELVETALHGTQLVQALFLHGKVLLKMDRYRDALDKWQRMMEEAVKIDDKHNMYRAAINSALSCFYLRSYEKARKFVDQALLYSDNDEQYYRARHILANILGDSNNYLGALEIHEELLAFYEDAGMLVDVQKTLHNIADIKYKLSKISIAKECYEDSLSLAYDLFYHFGICQTSIDLARLLISIGEKRKAEDVLNKALQVSGSKTTPQSNAMMLYLLSQCDNEGSQYEKFLLEADGFANSTDDRLVKLDISLSLGEFYESRGDNTKAFQYYKRAAYLSKS